MLAVGPIPPDVEKTDTLIIHSFLLLILLVALTEESVWSGYLGNFQM